MTAPSGLVIVDKPSGITSHDVVARVRRLVGTRRVGHAGTLDPMATGVLVVGVEKATRLLGYLTLTEKTYVATIRLGQSTSTDDAEGEPTGGSPATDLVPGALDAEIAELTGDIWQVPPGVSAIKVNGQRAYKLTRAGAAPELAARPVTVYEFTVTDVRQTAEFLDVDAVIRCSSGTYIRALARDLGAALGTGGHLTALRRTAVGPYRLDQAHTLQDLENQTHQNRDLERTVVTPPPKSAPAAPSAAAITREPAVAAPAAEAITREPAAAAPSPEAARHVARPIAWITPLAEAAAEAFPRLDLTADEARRLAQGARLQLPPQPPLAPQPPAEPSPILHTPPADAKTWPIPGTPIAAFAPDDTLVALVTTDSGCLRSLAVLVDAPPAVRADV
jgi:tRNA pseudouridine55 synthase